MSELQKLSRAQGRVGAVGKSRIFQKTIIDIASEDQIRMYVDSVLERFSYYRLVLTLAAM